MRRRVLRCLAFAPICLLAAGCTTSSTAQSSASNGTSARMISGDSLGYAVFRPGKATQSWSGEDRRSPTFAEVPGNTDR